MLNSRLKKLKEAVAIFSECLAIDKFFLEAYISRGNTFLDYGNPEGIEAAQCDYQRALAIKPTYVPARYGVLCNTPSIILVLILYRFYCLIVS